MTLTFDQVILFLIAAHQLITIIIFAKLFLSPSMLPKVMGPTRTFSTEVYAQSLSADCDLDLLPIDMFFVRDTLSCRDNDLCQIIFESHHASQNYGSDTNRFH